MTESDPLDASRFVVDDGRVFALLGDGFYGSDAPYGALVADDGTDTFVLAPGQVTHSFGSFEVAEIDRPISLNGDGTAAVIVETDGTVSLWWLADGRQLLSIRGDSAQPRWVSEVYAPKSATAVSWDATRLAVRNAARPDKPTSWTIVDIDVDAWLQRADADEG